MLNRGVEALLTFFVFKLIEHFRVCMAEGGCITIQALVVIVFRKECLIGKKKKKK